MPVDWVTVPAEPLLGHVEAAVRSGAGAVLIGPAGVGKTHAGPRGRGESRRRLRSRRHGSPATAASAVPFAAFGDLIEVADTGKTAAVLRAARESVGDGVLLVVDDAHALDKLSAALVHQLAVSGAARLILVVDSDESMPDGLSTLVRDDLVAQIELRRSRLRRPLLDEQVGEFVAGLPRRHPRRWSTWPSPNRCRSPS